MQKTILFDLDGTLIDSTPAILYSFDNAFLSHGKARPDHEKLKSLIGHTLDDMFFQLGAPKDEVKNYIDSYREFYHSVFLAQTCLLDSAKEAILMASEFAELGVVTTKGSRFLPKLLNHLGVGKYFKTLVGKDCVKKPKPDAEPINLALSRLGVSDKSGVFMIGDTPIDAKAAKNANVTALSVLCGYASLEILQACNDKIFTNTL
nr:HAD family hydrolase [Campylobacter sp.]